MAQVNATMIKELRDRTGVSMGKCKEALEVANGNMEEAIAHLRKTGMASVVKKEGRTANEGTIGIAETDKAVILVEVNAETDFVARNERFQQFVREIADDIAKTLPSDLEQFKQQKFSKDPHLTIEEYRASIVQAIGENIQIRRFQILPKASNKSFGVYSHHSGKLVTVIELAGANGEESFARDIAMHTAVAAPEYLSEKEIPENILDREREIAKEQVPANKPANIIDKIIQGKLVAFFDAHCLLRQKFFKNESVTVADLVNQRAKEVGKPLSVTSFLRWNVGQK